MLLQNENPNRIGKAKKAGSTDYCENTFRWCGMTILEEETVKEFGYNPDGLLPHSNKKILAACDDCGKVRVTSKNAYYGLCHLCGCQSPERRRKLSLANTGKYPTEETRRKLSEAGKGRHHTEETKKKMSEHQKGERSRNYGKHPSEKTRRKMSDARKGEKHWNYGKHPSKETLEKMRQSHKGQKPSEETRKKQSEQRKGENNPNFGKKFSEEHRLKLSLSHKGKRLSKETRLRMSKAFKHKKVKTHHTYPEHVFEQICKDCDLPYKYTGDGSFWIGRNPSINPDFVDCNGGKTAIEIFGDYWHSPLLRHNISYPQTLKGREKLLKKYGWKLIVLWESDLRREDAEEFVLTFLKKEKAI